jgi:hypothetical protein
VDWGGVSDIDRERCLGVHAQRVVTSA